MRLSQGIQGTPETCLILTTVTSDQGPLILGCVGFACSSLDHHGYDIPPLITKAQCAAWFTADVKESQCRCPCSTGVASLALCTVATVVDSCSPCMGRSRFAISPYSSAVLHIYSSNSLWDFFSCFTVYVYVQAAWLNWVPCLCCTYATLKKIKFSCCFLFCFGFLIYFFYFSLTFSNSKPFLKIPSFP